MKIDFYNNNNIPFYIPNSKQQFDDENFLYFEKENKDQRTHTNTIEEPDKQFPLKKIEDEEQSQNNNNVIYISPNTHDIQEQPYEIKDKCKQDKNLKIEQLKDLKKKIKHILKFFNSRNR